MFEKPKNEDGLDEAMASLLLEMKEYSGAEEDYQKMVRQLDLLCKIKAMNKPDRVSMDTLATIGGNLAGILLILHFEKANVITSKALSFVMKAR